jgi:hypothetical protein
VILAAQPVHLTSHDPLAGLADLVVPDPVSWRPQAWGWWVVAGLLVVAALALVIRWARRYAADRYRREALSEWGDLDARLGDDSGREAALAELAALIKRTALAAWPRAEVASLSGGAWVEFLRSHAGRARVDGPLASLLDAAEYQPASLVSVSSPDARACARAVREWIEGHRVSA